MDTADSDKAETKEPKESFQAAIYRIRNWLIPQMMIAAFILLILNVIFGPNALDGFDLFACGLIGMSLALIIPRWAWLIAFFILFVQLVVSWLLSLHWLDNTVLSSTFEAHEDAIFFMVVFNTLWSFGMRDGEYEHRYGSTDNPRTN